MAHPELDIDKHRAVVEVRDQLRAARAEYADAEETLANATEAAKGLEDAALRVEALVELGEAKPAEAKAARANYDDMEASRLEAARAVKRKGYVIERLQERLEEARTAARAEVEAWGRNEMRERVTALSQALSAVQEANASLLQLEDALTGSGAYPNRHGEYLAWEDLRVSPKSTSDRAHWEGRHAMAKQTTKLRAWRDDARRMGYDV